MPPAFIDKHSLISTCCLSAITYIPCYIGPSFDCCVWYHLDLPIHPTFRLLRTPCLGYRQRAERQRPSNSSVRGSEVQSVDVGLILENDASGSRKRLPAVPETRRTRTRTSLCTSSVTVERRWAEDTKHTFGQNQCAEESILEAKPAEKRIGYIRFRWSYYSCSR